VYIVGYFCIIKSEGLFCGTACLEDRRFDAYDVYGIEVKSLGFFWNIKSEEL
jgi:hypothetical protein